MSVIMVSDQAMKFQIKIDKHMRIKEEQKKKEHEESLQEVVLGVPTCQDLASHLPVNKSVT